MSHTIPNGAVVERPLDAHALNRQAIDRLMNGDADGALADFRRCVELDSAFPLAWNNSGLVRLELGQYREAQTDFDRALALQPDYPEALTNRGRARQALGDLAGALADFEAALACCQGPFVAAILHNRGSVRQLLGDRQGALVDFDQALTINPDQVSTYVHRAEARKEMGDLAGARADLDLALERATPHRRATVLHKRGGVRGLQGDFAGAVADYNEALTLEPANAIFYLSRANARYHLRDGRAVVDYRLAFRLDADTTTRELARMIQSDARWDVAATLDNCNKHLRINPRDSVALVRRALTLLLLGQTTEAAEALAAVYAQFPDLQPHLEALAASVQAPVQGGHGGVAAAPRPPKA